MVKMKKQYSKGESLHKLGKESQDGDKVHGLTENVLISFSKQPFWKSLIWNLS